jgi:hypothetical protein
MTDGVLRSDPGTCPCQDGKVNPRRFFPSGVLPVGDHVWVTDEGGTAWVLLTGDPLAVSTVVDLPMARAGGGPRRSVGIALAGQHLWAPTEDGLVRLSLAGEIQQMMDLGAGPNALAAGDGSLWAAMGRGGVLARVGLEGLEVTRIDLGGPLDAVVAGAEGAWVFRRSDDTVVHVDPAGRRVLGEVQLEGGCWGMGLGQGEVVVAFMTNRAMRGGFARISRTTGELAGIIQRHTLPAGLAVSGDKAWVASLVEEDLTGVGADEESTMPEAQSVIERVDLGTGTVGAVIHVAGQIMDLTGDGTRLLAMVFSRDAQAVQVVPVDAVSGVVGPPVMFSDVDLSGFSEPPLRILGPAGMAREPRPHPAPPTTVAEVEERARASAEAAVRSSVQGWSGRTGAPLPPRPYMPGFEFEAVRLAGEHPHTRLQFIFRAEHFADCRYGWDADLWDHEDAEDDEDDKRELPDPDSLAGEILIGLMENLEAAGYGPPDESEPDEEGITWVRHPYGGRASWDWTFADRVERVLRQYVPSARPFSREMVRQLLASGVESTDDLASIVTGDRTDDLAAVALWLLGELGDSTAVTPLIDALTDRDEQGRLRCIAKLQVLVGREHEPALLGAIRAEDAPAVRAALLDTLCVGATTTRDLALALLTAGREPAVVRAAAARTLGCTSVGEPEVVAALTSALDDSDAGAVAGAARGLALCVPSQAARLLAGLVGDTRPVGDDDSVGDFVAGELDALTRRCR